MSAKYDMDTLLKARPERGWIIMQEAPKGFSYITHMKQYAVTSLTNIHCLTPGLEESQTRWITIYSVAPLKGGSLKYRLNIIDTPGFGDTERSKSDIDKQIKTLFSPENTVCLHAVCIVTKGNNNRLNTYQKKVFNSILSIFGNDIIKNILVITTHNNVPNPAVLAVLKKAEVPFDRETPLAFKKHFSFDNKPFVERDEIAKRAWRLSNESLKSLFEYIDTLFPCSLHLTRQVLDKMIRAVHEIKYLEIHLRKRLRKRCQIRQELRVLEQHQKDVEAMKISIAKSEKEMSFNQSHIAKAEEDINKLKQASEEYFSKMQVTRTIYEICRRDLPEPDKSLNCHTCKMTCAPEAGIAKYLPNYFSSTMSLLGNCRICLKECNSTAHSIDSFEYVTKEIEVVETLSHMLEQYKATVDKLNETHNYSAQCKAKKDKISENLLKEVQQHSERQTEAKCLTQCIDTYKADLREMENSVKTAMVNLCESYDILVKNQLRMTHQSLREYLESRFNDKDKDMLLTELEPFL